MVRYKEFFDISNSKNNLSSPLRVPLYLLHLGGAWPYEDGYTNKWYLAYAIFIITFFSMTHTTLQIINFLFIYHDIQLLAASLYIVLSDIVGIIKVILFMKNNLLLKKIIRTIDSESFQPRTDKQQKLLQVRINFWKLIMEIFGGAAIFTGILWTLYPLVDETSREQKRLPFISWYPFDYKQSKYFVLTYIYQIIAVHCMTIINIPGDTLFAGIMAYGAAQCMLLSDNLRNLYDYTRRTLKKNSCLEYMADNEKVIYKHMEDCFLELIRYHHEILIFTQDCNEFMDPIAMAQFATTVLVLCLTMFQLTLVVPFSTEFASLIFYQSAIFVQVLMYCWFGNEVILESARISDAIFESDWTNTSLNFKKNMLFFMCRAQRPIRFRALRFFGFSLETFSKIVRSSWSYFAVLRTSNQKNN